MKLNFICRDCDLTGSSSDVDIILSPLDEDSSVESEHILLALNETKIDACTKSDGTSENSDGTYLTSPYPLFREII